MLADAAQKIYAKRVEIKHCNLNRVPQGFKFGPINKRLKFDTQNMPTKL